MFCDKHGESDLCPYCEVEECHERINELERALASMSAAVADEEGVGLFGVRRIADKALARRDALVAADECDHAADEADSQAQFHRDAIDRHEAADALHRYAGYMRDRANRLRREAEGAE